MLYKEFSRYLQLPGLNHHFAIVLLEDIPDDLFEYIQTAGETDYPLIYVISLVSGFLFCFQNIEDYSFFKLKYLGDIILVSTEDAVEFVIENLIEDNDAAEEVINAYILGGDNMKKSILHMLWYKDAEELFFELKSNVGILGELQDYCSAA